MKRLLLLPAMLALSACEQAVSREPLLADNGAVLQDGLWAVLETGCPEPTNSAVQSWTECATPIWLKGREVKHIQRTPVRSGFVIGSGSPQIVQFAGADDAGQPRFSYYAVRPEDRPPHRSASVWGILCDREPPEPSEAAECFVEDEAELRRLAKLVVQQKPGRAVHIGPG